MYKNTHSLRHIKGRTFNELQSAGVQLVLSKYLFLYYLYN